MSKTLLKMAMGSTLDFHICNQQNIWLSNKEEKIVVRRTAQAWFVTMPGLKPTWFRNQAIAAAMIVGYEHAGLRYNPVTLVSGEAS